MNITKSFKWHDDIKSRTVPALVSLISNRIGISLNARRVTWRDGSTSFLVYTSILEVHEVGDTDELLKFISDNMYIFVECLRESIIIEVK